MKKTALSSLLVSLFLCSFHLFAQTTTNNLQVVKLTCSNLKSENQEFFFENDTLILSYDFFNENGPVYFKIYNKLGVPLYINWAKCAYIIGSNKANYWEDKTIIKTKTKSTSFDWTSFVSSEWAKTNGTMVREEKVTFIPPKTEISCVKFYASKIPVYKGLTLGEKQPFEVEQTWLVAESAKRKKVTFMKYIFTEENSPLKFRNYLTFSTSEDFKTEFSMDNLFWVSEVQEVDQKYFQNQGYKYSKKDYLSSVLFHRSRSPEQRLASKNFPYFDKKLYFIFKDQ